MLPISSINNLKRKFVNFGENYKAKKIKSKQNFLFDLPTDVLFYICSYLIFEEDATKIRSLNSSFKKIKYEKLEKYLHIYEPHGLTVTVEDGKVKYKNYQNGKLHGLTTIWKNNLLFETINYTNDVFDGQNCIYRNGNLYINRNFKLGFVDGPMVIYHHSGRIQSLENFSSSKLHGKSYFYYDVPESFKKEEITYIFGEKNGERKLWNNKGIQTSYQNFKNNYLDGPSMTWFEKKLLSVENFKRGTKNGVSTYFTDSNIVHYNTFINDKLDGMSSIFINDKLYSELNFESNKKNGPHTCWNKEGNIISICEYISDLKHGIEKNWYVNGTLKSAESYFKGIQHGDSLYFYENGVIERRLHYRNGFVSNLYYFNQDGKCDYIQTF
jgi:antitoxin component YwqK of YwqJK toxin-antitoxin module